MNVSLMHALCKLRKGSFYRYDFFNYFHGNLKYFENIDCTCNFLNIFSSVLTVGNPQAFFSINQKKFYSKY